jgi:hypothetical protein
MGKKQEKITRLFKNTHIKNCLHNKKNTIQNILKPNTDTDKYEKMGISNEMYELPIKIHRCFGSDA